uniref:Cuticle protein 6 n=2 Tax=Lutzomyia longipalpis TaxID=7200 RepID=A0A1B0CRE0_LUTLO
MKAVLILVTLALSTLDAATIYYTPPYSYILSNPYGLTYPYYTTNTGVVLSYAPAPDGTRHHRPGHEGQDTESNPREPEDDDRPNGPEPTTQRPSLPLLYHWSPYSILPSQLAVPSASQYHSQDQIGQYHYGYANQHSAKSELKTSDGITRGGYSYIDSNGKLQSVNYVSDALGFRVAATNLPKPSPIADSPEIAAARREHMQAHQEAIDRLAAAQSAGDGHHGERERPPQEPQQRNNGHSE